MTDIDYIALATEAFRTTPSLRQADQARAVVAALREQGFVVVRVDHLGKLLAAYINDQREWHIEHYGNTDDLDSWLDTPAIKHIKEVIGEEESND